MKIKGPPGEFGFRALYRQKLSPEISGHTIISGWRISTEIFFNEQELEQTFKKENWDVRWPVEVWDDGGVYVPTIEELTGEA